MLDRENVLQFMATHHFILSKKFLHILLKQTRTTWLLFFYMFQFPLFVLVIIIKRELIPNFLKWLFTGVYFNGCMFLNWSKYVLYIVLTFKSKLLVRFCFGTFLHWTQGCNQKWCNPKCTFCSFSIIHYSTMVYKLHVIVLHIIIIGSVTGRETQDIPVFRGYKCSNTCVWYTLSKAGCVFLYTCIWG